MSSLHFYINGNPYYINDPDPRTLLVDFLRSPEVGLTGSKKSCGQGGCGACTVMLSYYQPETKKVYFESVNSCLRPICSLDGMEITTTEGIGSVNSAVDETQFHIAKDNGSQCGFCTPGWVMNMHASLLERGKEGFTKQEIEALFDGNICRCTGYRPILYAFKHFATDWDEKKDSEGVVQCIVDKAEKPGKKPVTAPDFPDAFKEKPRKVTFEKNGYHWERVLTLKELDGILRQGIGPEDLKMVVGNTSYGVYNPFPLDQADYYNPHYFVDVNGLKELHYFQSRKTLSFGAATSYTKLLDELTALQSKYKKGKLQTVDALHYMARRTAGKIVRNAASVGGNTMIAIHHIEKGSPFPSDLLTAMAGLDAKVSVYSTKWRKVKTMGLLEFATKYPRQKVLNRHSVLIGYEIPYLSDRSYARTYKVAQRTENAHSIVNACLVFELDKHKKKIVKATIVIGGITPIAMHAKKTERALKGKALNNKVLRRALSVLRKEIQGWNEKFKERLSGVPNEGFSDEYRVHLAESYLYQHFIYVLESTSPKALPPEILSGAERHARPVTTGKQSYEKYESEYPVNEPIVKLEAFLQASGEALYNQDRELIRSGMYGAWVNSAKALAKISYQIPGEKKAKSATVEELCGFLRAQYPGFRDFITYKDIPNQEAVFQGSAKDDPIMVKDEVTSYGQSIGIILAESEMLAEEIAYFVTHECISYKTKTPLISLPRAIEEGSIFKDCPNGSSFPTHIWKITRAGTTLDWTEETTTIEPKDTVITKTGIVDGVECLIIEGTQEIGGQIHFYMGCQTAVAIPQEHDNLLIYADTQSPDSVQSAVMETLNLQANEVDIRVKRVAGGYGGKTTRSPYVAAPVAVAAWKHRKPVKVMMKRENDTSMVGHRHPTLTKFQIAIGTGADDPANEGRIMGLKVDWWFNGGNTYDCSFTVMDCMQLRSSSGYFIPNYQSSGDVAQTNISSNTAFRAFGMLQGILGMEDGIEAAAWQLGIRPEDIREKNLYQQGQTTPYGQPLDHLYIDEVWAYTRKKVDFDSRLEAVREFNRNNRWKKRGISMIPVLYGSGYNAVFLEQGGALVEIYDQDGTVIVRQGGVDMGQGLNTKVAQVTAESLNVPLDFINIGETDVQVVPNPISTGASTGSAYNGAAAKEACDRLRKRLEDFCFDLLKTNGPDWCKQHGVNFWDYEEGWKAPFGEGIMWANIVKMAYNSRVNLSQQVRFRQAGGEGIDSGLRYHDGSCSETVNYFVGFTYSAACSEVEVDILTGVTTVLRSDIIYDVGKSLNPAIDIGQIEGGFVQGLGYVLTEALVYEESGENKGRLNTLNTWRYKPPAHTTIPIEMNVDLFPRNAVGVEADPNLLFGAKEVGEPPLVLGSTIYFAVKHAVLDARSDKGITDWFRMDAPLTPQQVREHALVDPEDMFL